jgi:hypothetical protein
VAQTPGKLLAVPEQARHVRHVTAAHLDLFTSVKARSHQRKHGQRRRDQQQRRRHPERQRKADRRGDTCDKQLLQCAEALHDDLDVIRQHIGNLRRAGRSKRTDVGSNQACVHLTAQTHAIAAGKTCPNA